MLDFIFILNLVQTRLKYELLSDRDLLTRRRHPQIMQHYQRSHIALLDKDV